MIRQWVSRVALLGVVTTTIGCDQVSKHLATSHLMGVPRQSFLGDSIRLQYAQNTGAFLSLGSGLPVGLRTALFTFGTAIMLAACALAIVRHRRMTGGRMTLSVLGLTLVVAGGASNLADRVLHGAVVDFLNVGLGSLRAGIFNVADMAIMTGIGLILLWTARQKKPAEGAT
jgi:signal peptidase II